MEKQQNNPLILVVEDENLYAKIYENKFTKEGFEVLLAKNGLEALKLAETPGLNLILLDMILPEMNGFTVLEKLKSNKKTKEIRVVVLSNLGQPSDLEKAKHLGAEDYWVKSNTSISDLVAKVKGLLN